MRLRQAGQLTERLPPLPRAGRGVACGRPGRRRRGFDREETAGVNFGLRQNESWVRGYAHPRSMTAQKSLTLQQFSDRVAYLSPLVMITRKP